MMEPMDRSIPPVRMTRVWARLAKTRGVIRVNRLTLLFQVKKLPSKKQDRT